jgi:hypothetical protein
MHDDPPTTPQGHGSVWRDLWDHVQHILAVTIWFAVVAAPALALDRLGHFLNHPADRATFVSRSLIWLADVIFVVDAISLVVYLAKYIHAFVKRSNR